MSLLNLVFASPKPSYGKVGNIQFDATLSENHSYPAEVTNFPVEEGYNISDHVILLPFVLDMRGMVTNSPVVFFSGLSAGIASRKIEAFEQLVELRNNRIPFDVVTGLTSYKNMIIRNLDFPRDPNTGDKLDFLISMQKIDVVDTKQVEIPAEKVKEGKKDLAQSTQDAGTQTTTPANAVQEEKGSSLLNSWIFGG